MRAEPLAGFPECLSMRPWWLAMTTDCTHAEWSMCLQHVNNLPLERITPPARNAKDPPVGCELPWREIEQTAGLRDANGGEHLA